MQLLSGPLKDRSSSWRLASYQLGQGAYEGGLATTIGLIPLGLANDSASFFMKTLNPVSFEHGIITAGATAIVGAAIAFVSTNNDNWNDISLHRSVQRPLSKKVGFFAAAAVATTALIMGGTRPIEPMPQTFVPATSAQPR